MTANKCNIILTKIYWYFSYNKIFILRKGPNITAMWYFLVSITKHIKTIYHGFERSLTF